MLGGGRLTIIKDSLYPFHCVGCGAEGEWWCESCRNQLSNWAEPTCFRCGQANLDGRICFRCQNHSVVDGATVLFNYKTNAPVARLIQDFKYHFVSELEELWHEIIGQGSQRLDFLFQSPIVVIPVPLHPRRERERGFNQSKILAEIIWQKNKNAGRDCDFDYQGLRRRRFTKQQAKLDAPARQKNLKDAFVWTGSDPVPPRVILVDDVITTGATVEECARVLKQQGAHWIWAVALAKG